MAQYDIIFVVNEAVSGNDNAELRIKLLQGQLIAGTTTRPMAVNEPNDNEQFLMSDTTEDTGLRFVDLANVGYRKIHVGTSAPTDLSMLWLDTN